MIHMFHKSFIFAHFWVKNTLPTAQNAVKIYKNGVKIADFGQKKPDFRLKKAILGLF